MKAAQIYRHLISTNEKVAKTIKDYRKSNKNENNKRPKRA